MMKILTAATLVLLAGTSLSAQGPETFDHSLFDDLLRAHVSRDGLVDYDAFGRSPEFQLYLAALAEARLDPLAEPERLALWINAYNAYTIELINRHGERESIRNLDEIEQDIIRKRFSVPRIHFALVCAALGCPPLRNEAYVGEELDRQLGDQARAFLVESPEKNRVDPTNGVVHLSPIFDWYRDDFPVGFAGLGGFLARFHPPGPARDLLQSGRFQVEFTDYDWSLNQS